MKHSYSSLRWVALAALLTGSALQAQAQNLGYPAGSVVNTTGTFASLGAGATNIAVNDLDDANSGPQNIGFTFNYNGQAFTQFILNTNGGIRFGSTPPAETLDNFLAEPDPTYTNMVFPMFNDLVGTPGSFRVATTGTAPSRVCTIEWGNMTEYSDAQFTGFSFQLKLYETTRVIEFVYGPSTPGATTEESYGLVGLKGSSDAPGQVTLASKDITTPWATPTFQNTTYTTTYFEYDRTSLPVSGRTFRFVPGVLSNRDAALDRALSVYPNPSNGEFTLEARTDNNTLLQVEVLNSLGQLVHTAALRPGLATPVNLPNLAAGLYHLKVSSGSSFTTRTITIQ